MKNLFDRTLWFLTGGRDPGVHSPVLRWHYKTVYRLKIPTSAILSRDTDIEIPISTRLFESGVLTRRMAIESTRPVNNLIPFHLTQVPVKGLTLPLIRVITHIKRFFPRLVLLSPDFAFTAPCHTIDVITDNVRNVSQNQVERYTSTAIPALTIPASTAVGTIKPQRIPGYFIRVKPAMFNSYSRSELVLRKIGFAEALKIRRDSIDLIALFRDVDVSSVSTMEFDKRTRTLILYPLFDGDFVTQRRDIIVGRDTRSGKIHIAKYKPK